MQKKFIKLVFITLLILVNPIMAKNEAPRERGFDESNGLNQRSVQIEIDPVQKRIFLPFIVNVHFCDNVTEIPTIECKALVALYESTDGPNWNFVRDWLTNKTPCSWYGITCSEEDTNNVTQLILSGDFWPGTIGLKGSLPTELGNLTYLQELDLSYNQLNGGLPSELGNLDNLKSLTMWDSQLDGVIPYTLGNLKNLTVLHLGKNKLSGDIPAELGNLSQLQNLSLYDNQLSGNIPPELGNLNNLKWLQLYRNQLSGNIPPDLSNLNNVTLLDLHNNKLTGHVPVELSNLSNLASLQLQQNLLSGSVPESFKNLTNLHVFYFYDTGLCEPPGDDFQSWLKTLDLLQGTGVVCN